jgi:large subunit ribosomal protein L29
MKASELREKGIDELNADLEGLFEEQFNLRMQRGSGQDAKPHLFNSVKKNIARVKTIINQKLGDK